jgi:hypothetical protein
MIEVHEDARGRIHLLADDADDEVPAYAAAAVVAGNGIVWDTPIWLADDSATAMIEAGMIEPDPLRRVKVCGRTVYLYEKTGG